MKKPTKKITESHNKARAELHKMAETHNNKIMGVGSTKRIDGHSYTLNRVEISKNTVEHIAMLFTDMGKIKSYRIHRGEFGYELWVR